MSDISLFLYIIFNCLVIFTISFLMEVYKKTIRKDKCKHFECWIVGFILSTLGVLFLKSTGMMKLLFCEHLHAKTWVDYLLYIIIYYYIQLQSDMILVKKLIKSLFISLLKKSNIDDEQIELICKSIEKKETC